MSWFPYNTAVSRKVVGKTKRISAHDIPKRNCGLISDYGSLILISRKSEKNLTVTTRHHKFDEIYSFIFQSRRKEVNRSSQIGQKINRYPWKKLTLWHPVEVKINNKDVKTLLSYWKSSHKAPLSWKCVQSNWQVENG